MPRLFSLIVLLAAGVCAQTTFLPLQDLKPGMRGVGKTVFAGDRVEEFQAEILGVLENIGPKQSFILARLSGGPLDHTGVLQGMSGSPVYIDGKLIGAVAMAFPFAKEPIAGIRPIEEMVRAGSGPSERSAADLRRPHRHRPSRAGCPSRASVLAGDSRLVDVATPVSFGGFTARHHRTLRTAAARAGPGAAPGRAGRRPLRPAHGQSGSASSPAP